ncbi:biotin synthase BioB [Devriesea agamarum]|uniref:biotin synthase BioB n=1 Tax=Devriesea agamarum TaxID=472569 RepID=UPI00071DD079|nr:biotin synthase BioB [Devriesea agamarum]
MTHCPDDLASAVLAGHTTTREEALDLLRTPPTGVPALVAAAHRLRTAAFGTEVKVNYLVNLRSGLCPEDCGYCSQRLGSAADILTYSWLSPEETLRQAQAGIAGGARRVCMVASGRGPSTRDVERVAGTVEALKETHPEVEVCACLGFVDEAKAQRLREAGVDAYNHNLNTSRAQYDSVCTTHTYDDRVDTVRASREAGLSPCSGLITGMGESDEDLVDTVRELVALDVDSIPVNFLMPFKGTPMEGRWELTPLRCLTVLCMVRFLAPRTEIRIAGGREIHLRSLQTQALYVANSLFLGDYLTSQGQAARADLEMIRDAGLTLAGGTDLTALLARIDADTATQSSPTRPCDTEACDSGTCGDNPTDGENPTDAGGHSVPPLALRRRGAGTDLAPNA